MQRCLLSGDGRPSIFLSGSLRRNRQSGGEWVFGSLRLIPLIGRGSSSKGLQLLSRSLALCALLP
ncbi:hypothetical protein EJ110_NYTH40695 [Nymphaea thermarum]|nr:hypothetical protein EJ110_NYTH40695 [Nymphaea thermarum]